MHTGSVIYQAHFRNCRIPTTYWVIMPTVSPHSQTPPTPILEQFINHPTPPLPPLADADFLITPYSGAAAGSSHDVFNFFHSQLRITIERTFGILLTLFGILQKPMGFDVDLSVAVVQSCMRVHNFRINNGCQAPRRSAVLNYAADQDADGLILNDPRKLKNCFCLMH